MSTYISTESLFNELTKIAEQTPSPTGERKRSILPALKAMGVGALGGAAGFGVAELLGRNLSFFKGPHGVDPSVFSKRLSAAKVILPIMGGAAVMLADRYRQKMNEQYSKVKGFQDRK